MMPASAFQIYSVTVPHGVKPGMPLQFSTPGGMMQIVCPDHATEGSTIDVEAPIVVASTVATPVVQSTTQMATVSLSEPQAAPVSQNIKRSDSSEMDGRMGEARSGCYANEQCPCCYMTYMVVSPPHLFAGPCCAFCGLCCCFLCPPGMCGNYKEIAPGSATFAMRHTTERRTFISPTRFADSGGILNAKDEVSYRICSC